MNDDRSSLSLSGSLSPIDAGDISDELVWSTVNSLFAVGLDLSSTRALADDVVSERIGRVVSELDTIISNLRTRAYSPTPNGQCAQDSSSSTD